MGELSYPYGEYWIDFRRLGNPLMGVTRRWIETQDTFCADLAELSMRPFAVVAFGFKVTPPCLSAYDLSVFVPA